MADIKITLESKQLYPAIVNLKQFSNNTDVLTFEMENYTYETTDLSKLDAYAVCDMVNQEVDEVKLEKQVVEEKLRLKWVVSGYTTQLSGHINYQIVFKDNTQENAKIWYSHQGIIFVNSSINGDEHIAAKYPTILQQWEERMKDVNKYASNAIDLAGDSAIQAQQSANQAEQSAINAANQAADATDSATKAEQMKDYINQLIDYEGVNGIEKEVAAARGGKTTLGTRLDDMDDVDKNHEARIDYIETNGAVAGDTIPVGGIVGYDDDGLIPSGWEEIFTVNKSKYVIATSYQISATSAYFFIEYPEMSGTPVITIRDGLTEVQKPDGTSIAVTGHNFTTVTKSYAILRISYASQTSVPQFVKFAKYLDIVVSVSDEFNGSTRYIKKIEQYASLIGKVFDSLENNSTTDAPSIRATKEALESKANKIAILNKEGTEVVKEIDLGFKMLEEEGNVTKGQLLDKDTKGVLYPETTKERVIGLDKDLSSINKEITDIKNQGVQVADTLPIGSTILWNEEEPPSSDLYEEVDIDVFNPRQLLINNDFQVNQRGQTSYSAVGYGLDMWYLIATEANPISPIEGGGILINKATSNQNIVRQYCDKMGASDIGKQFTLVLNIETDKAFTGVIGLGVQRQNVDVEVGNKIYSYTFTINEDDTKDTRGVDVLILNADNSITNAPQIKIWYADLFEGDIAYPHVKEDKAIALMRCCDIVQVLKIVSWNHIPFTHDQKNAYVKIPYKFPYNIEGATLTHNMNGLTVIGYPNISISSVSQQIINDKNSILELYIVLTDGNIGGNATGGESFYIKDEDIVITLSKEPL